MYNGRTDIIWEYKYRMLSTAWAREQGRERGREGGKGGREGREGREGRREGGREGGGREGDGPTDGGSPCNLITLQQAAGEGQGVP